ncbi:MAG: PepSY domain-containing protein [Butyricicoccus pullicaecorum]|nr:PepSY domain-containing protein [Butyricicoccus pullicaecorum]
MKRQTITKLLCTAAITASLSGIASASTAVTAQLDPNVTVQIDGTARTFFNAQGKEVHPIVYQGTTYLPLRSMGELLNKNVDWNAATNTVTLGGTRTTGNPTGVPDTAARPTAISFEISPEITVIIDGSARTFYDAAGKQVAPAVYNGSIYLPIRSIGEIMNKTVSWDAATQTVILSGTSGGIVTDYDTSGGTTVTPPSQPSQPTTPPTTAGVTLEQAKQTALQHAGKIASPVRFVKAQKDFDDGRWLYEIEFIVSSANGYLEYDYDIDAATGKILSYDYDAEGYVPSVTPPDSKPSNPSSSAGISEATAKQNALARVPGATTANLYEFKKDFDDGRWEYEGKIVYKQMEYEFTIDASTGKFLDWDVESIYD